MDARVSSAIRLRYCVTGRLTPRSVPPIIRYPGREARALRTMRTLPFCLMLWRLRFFMSLDRSIVLRIVMTQETH
jgi:hypothetical protein